MIRLFSRGALRINKLTGSGLIKINRFDNLSRCLSSHPDCIKIIEEGVKKLRIYYEIDLLPADLNWNYLLDENNLKTIDSNNSNRKGTGDIKTVVN